MKVPQGANTLGQVVMRAVLDQLRPMSVTFSELPEEQQQEFIDSLGEAIQPKIVEGMRDALALGWPAVSAKLAKANITEDGVSVGLALPLAQLHEIADNVGSNIVLVLVDPLVHAEGVKEFKADLDQPDLQFGTPDAGVAGTGDGVPGAPAESSA